MSQTTPATSAKTSHETPARPPAQPPARLALEDGSVFHGTAFGDTSERTVDAEVCFNTSLTGYQEIITDPSYAGQFVTMTYPLIGNYGVNDIDTESTRPQVAGFVVRELAHSESNYRATSHLNDWLARHQVMGIADIDTRALTRKLRTQGAMVGVMSTDSTLSDEQLVAAAKSAPGLVGRNLAGSVSCDDASRFDLDLGMWRPIQGRSKPPTDRPHVVAIDCGAKQNILRNLVDVGCAVTAVPYDITPKAIMDLKPDGLFVSNGPGDPDPVQPTIDHLKQLHGEVPMFGICLGLQLLGLSLGAKRFKLRFGHRGGNQPVQNLGTQKVEITSQNHGFGIDEQSLRDVGGEPTHINLNDRTLEGFRHPELPIFAVQYHPEASPGPHDASYLFDCFLAMIETGKCPTAKQMHQAQAARSQLVTA